MFICFQTPNVLVKRTVTTLRTVGVRAGTNVREDYTHLVPVEADNTWTLRPNNVRPLNRPLVTVSDYDIVYVFLPSFLKNSLFPVNA